MLAMTPAIPMINFLILTVVKAMNSLLNIMFNVCILTKNRQFLVKTSLVFLYSTELLYSALQCLLISTSDKNIAVHILLQQSEIHSSII